MARRSSIVRVSVVGDARELSRAFAQAERDTQSLGQKLESVGKDFSSKVSLPIIAGFTLAAKSAAEFDESMTKVVTLVGIASDQVNAWRGEVSTLAAETAQSSAALADGLFLVTSAGFRGQAAMDVLETSAKAAALGLGEVSTVADAVTSAVNAYGAENLSAVRATEILTAAVREGKLEASTLAPVLGRLLPTASAMGIAFEDVAGSLAVMSRTGLDAAQASTSLSAIMTALLKPGAEANRALSQVGLSMSELRAIAAEPGGLIEVMRLLDGAFADNDEALARVVPNVEAFRGVMNVLSQDARIVDGVMGGVADSIGLVDTAWDQLNESPAFQLKQAVGELKAAGTELGAIVLPIVAEFAKAVAEVGRAFRNLDDFTQETIVRFGLILASIGPVLIILGKLATAWTAVKTAAIGAGIAQAGAGAAGAGAGFAAAGGGAAAAAGAAAAGSAAGLTARQIAQRATLGKIASQITPGRALVGALIADQTLLRRDVENTNRVFDEMRERALEGAIASGKYSDAQLGLADSMAAVGSGWKALQSPHQEAIFLTRLHAQEQDKLLRLISSPLTPDTSVFTRRISNAIDLTRNFAREQLALADPVLAKALAEQRAGEARDRFTEVSQDKKASDRDREKAAIDLLVAEAELDAMSQDLADTIGGPLIDSMNALIERSGLQHEFFQFLIDDMREFNRLAQETGTYLLPSGRRIPVRGLKEELVRHNQQTVE